ncbi:uncharacterized protein LY89DRAFT_353890 [Mollisia scopiformis]|uniref:Uncharacterized protein n=1 Tax=Mollisia scopiformis TaxID=149040 RepID=A0A132B635_MOLSC|nr:uncharacterized protein LY89DRAFT_353890 [Mollisia scopiformis]KUJ07876.1 hypothetical protein LY89DRAFT_353890 [Mollisia scopiformis]
MKYPLIRVSILGLLASCGASISVSAPTVNGDTTVTEPIILNSAGVQKGFVAPKPGSSVPNSTSVKLLPRSNILRKRDDYFCTGDAPDVDDCNEVINTALDDNETITIPDNLCFEISYQTCVGYVCSTPCGGYTFSTTWFGNTLSDLLSLCVDDGQGGEIYTTSDVIYEVGFVTDGEGFPQYEAC